jgi:hypothetical protein
MRNGDTVIHVEFISGPLAGQHRYFGSISAIYTQFARVEIGICYDRLCRKKLNTWNPYQNRNCIIRKGDVVRKPSNRKPPLRINANH